MGASGLVLFEAWSDGGQRPGIWMGSPEGVRALLQRGDQAPGLPDTYFDYFPLGASISETDNILVHATLRDAAGGPTRDSVWIGSPDGDFRLLAISGQHAVGMPDTDRYVAFAYYGLINRPGDVALLATLNVQSGDEVRRGIWTGSSAPLQPVAFSGAVLPETDRPVWTVNPPVMNQAGHILFHAYTTADFGDGLWFYADGKLTPVVLEGQVAPTPFPSRFFSFNYPIYINDLGEVAFGASVRDDQDRLSGVLVSGRPDSLRAIAAVGECAPLAQGTCEDVTFAPNTFNRLFLNNSGLVLFEGGLMGPGVDPSNDRGLWLASATGDLQFIFREGQALDLGNGGIRILEWFDLFEQRPGIPGGRGAFNDAGQFAFVASFTDGSAGIFIATIPEPAPAVLLALALSALSIRGRSTTMRGQRPSTTGSSPRRTSASNAEEASGVGESD